MIAIIHAKNGMPGVVEVAVRHNLLEYAELMLFLLVVMTYINAMSERCVFDALRAWLIHMGFSLRQWLLVTLTAGVGGSLLSIGSAAGVALMGRCGACIPLLRR